ncbi:Outer membrane cobalamin receptor protein [Daejeonella lutea]|uniref:Outer membrane cobalamin receptor protein n=1 Tax=Daejeonella lutea TaxID=572036 RepID=A0A1T5BXQ9_9SPHI|nr:Outer membrane cobalamin receptor protein [Daejeonella lutea]
MLVACFACLQASAQVDSISTLSDLSLEELLNVKVITASGYLQKTSEAPSTIQVISAKQIAERGYEELTDALRDIPGIDMIHLNGYAPTLIYFRGMYGAENLRALLMIDGIVENNIIGSNDMAGPAYNLHNAERIEIIWGPASVLYGANAYGGVINIITKKGADVNGVVAEKGFGTFNASMDKVSMGVRTTKFDISLSGSLYSTDGPRFSNRDPNYTASYVDKAYSITGSLGYIARRSVTTLGFRAYRTPMGWGTFFNSPTQFLGLPSQGYENKGVLGLLTRDVRNERSGLESPYARTIFLQNEFKPTEKFSLLTRAVYRETGIGEDSYVYLTVDGKKLYRIITASQSTRGFGEVLGNYSPSKNHKLSAGIQFFRDNVEKGSRQATIDTNTVYLIDGKQVVANLYSTFLPRKYDLRNNIGSYLQYIHTSEFLRKTNFTFGARYDYNSYYGSNFSPRVAIVNQPTDELTVKLQYGTAYRAPTNTEIYQAPLNVKLKEEKIRTYELNLGYEISKRAMFQLNGFRNKLSDVITIGNLSSNLTVNKNPAELTIHGIEGQMDYVYSSKLSTFVNFTIQDGRGKNTLTNQKGPVPGIANFKGNAGLSLNVQDLFNVSLTGNLIGKRRAPATSPYGSVDGYFLTHLNFRTRALFNERVTASLNIHNLFNTEWLDPGFRTADGFLFSTVLEQPRRTGMLKVAVRL